MVGESKANVEGVYDLNGLPEGPLRLEIESPGFRRGVITGVTASTDKTNVRDAQLEVGNVTETVEVRAQPSGLQTESAETGSRTLGSGRRAWT
jgi:hypothetical protein